MALPKRKTARAHQKRRRCLIRVKSLPKLVPCAQCNSPKLPHHVCPTCGTYGGKEIIEIKSPQKKTG